MKYILGILGLLVLVVGGVVFYSSTIIETAITKVGSEVLGVPVNVQKVDIGFLKGEARIAGLTVGNPEKYSGDKAVSLGKVYVKLNTRSLMSDKIIVEKVLISAPEVFYEGDFKTSNFQDIQTNLQKGATTSTKSQSVEKETTSTQADSSASAKKLQVDIVTIEKAAMHMLAHTPVGERKFDVSIPKIEIKGIGAKGDGATPEEVLQTVVGPFLGRIQNSAVNIIKETGVKGAMDKLKEEGGSVVDKLKNLF
ncbi:MAG: hypothetical protein CMF61_02360 [Magnetococcales bacterium]|nr:hypothetical protein [Magnetococcales bacterium]PPR17745.1 MAG: hypothetical protein CFH43_00650 [Pseudomonadota bacterium]